MLVFDSRQWPIKLWAAGKFRKFHQKISPENFWRQNFIGYNIEALLVMNNSLDNSLLHLLHRSSQVAGEYFAELAAQKQLKGMTPHLFFVLAAIGRGEGVTQADLVGKLGCGASKATEIIGRLQSKGLVVRSRNKLDADGLYLRLTDSGLEALHGCMSIAMRVDERLRDLLQAGKYGELAGQLRLIADAYGRGTAGR